jgi:hypothetical protein
LKIEQLYCQNENEIVPVRFTIPMQTFAKSDGTPALLKTVEEK